MTAQRTTILIKFEVDLDMVPGAWHEAEDWVEYVKQQLCNPTYDSRVQILDTTVNRKDIRVF